MRAILLLPLLNHPQDSIITFKFYDRTQKVHPDFSYTLRYLVLKDAVNSFSYITTSIKHGPNISTGVFLVFQSMPFKWENSGSGLFASVNVEITGWLSYNIFSGLSALSINNKFTLIYENSITIYILRNFPVYLIAGTGYQLRIIKSKELRTLAPSFVISTGFNPFYFFR